MAEPVRHRQTKGGENRYAQPTATKPHLDSTERRPFPGGVSYDDSAPIADLDRAVMGGARSSVAQLRSNGAVR